jgi:hypothetical protein
MGTPLCEGGKKMNELEILRTGFVAFIDGLWWGLRNNTGALTMYEGYSGGFRQMGKEIAQARGGKGPEKSAEIAGEIFNAIGLDNEVDGKDIYVKTCPIWNRILERGLEFSFHIEEICWKPLLQGISDITETRPVVENSLRLIHIERAKLEHRKSKAKRALDDGNITKGEYDKQISTIDRSTETAQKRGHYRFE